LFSAQRHQSSFPGCFTEHDRVRTESAPAFLTLLTGLPVLHAIYRNAIAVVDRHAQSELRSGFERRGQAERTDRQLDFVNGSFLCGVALNDSLGWTVAGWIPARTCFMADHNRVGQIRIGHKL